LNDLKRKEWLDVALDAFEADGGSLDIPLTLPPPERWPRACRVLPAMEAALLSKHNKSIPDQVESDLAQGYTVESPDYLNALDMALNPTPGMEDFNRLGPKTRQEIYRRVQGRKGRRGAPPRTWQQEVKRVQTCASLVILYDYLNQIGEPDPLEAAKESLSDRFHISAPTLANWWAEWNK